MECLVKLKAASPELNAASAAGAMEEGLNFRKPFVSRPPPTDESTYQTRRISTSAPYKPSQVSPQDAIPHPVTPPGPPLRAPPAHPPIRPPPTHQPRTEDSGRPPAPLCEVTASDLNKPTSPKRSGSATTAARSSRSSRARGCSTTGPSRPATGSPNWATGVPCWSTVTRATRWRPR